MPTPTKGARFGGSPSHQRLILANLAQALFENGRITTTEAKARRLRPYAEQLITKAKIDTVANRRQVVKVIRDQDVLHTLFTEIGPAMSTRPGGYTRITKIGPRKGDNAPMAVIEIVEAKEFGAQNQTPKKPAQKKKAEQAAPKAHASLKRLRSRTKPSPSPSRARTSVRDRGSGAGGRRHRGAGRRAGRRDRRRGGCRQGRRVDRDRGRSRRDGLRHRASSSHPSDGPVTPQGCRAVAIISSMMAPATSRGRP